jgi:hypothetical protein
MNSRIIKVNLEDGSIIELRRRFKDGVYTQIGNGSGIKSEQRELMDESEAKQVVKREILKGNSAIMIKHGSMFLVYYKWGK